MHRILGRYALWWCAAAPLAAFVWLLTQAGSVLDGDTPSQTVEWLPDLGLEVAVRLDAFALLMALLVAGIGVLVFAYTYAYFEDHEEPAVGSLGGWLTLFAGAMLGLVLADDVFTLFVFWELTAIASFFLTVFRRRDATVRRGASRELAVAGSGGLALLAGLVLISHRAGTTSISEIVAAPPETDGIVIGGLVLLLVGVFTRSAQVPFHRWLPSAMVAPTPVNGYLHAATIVKAGVYVIGRFAPAFADVGFWRPLVLTVGLSTLVLGAVRALFARDLKQILAWSTISQLGLLVTLFGVGVPELTEAACLVLLAHGLAKSALFMVVGIVEHQAHTLDMQGLRGLAGRMPLVAAIAALAAGSLAGIGPFIGFVGKQQVIAGLLDRGFGGSLAVLAVLVATASLTLAYSLRFLWGAFGTESADDAGRERLGGEVARPRLVLVTPAALLAGLCVVFGVAPRAVQRLVADAALAIQPDARIEGLTLVPPIGVGLAISLLVVAVGAGVFAARWSRERARA